MPCPRRKAGGLFSRVLRGDGQPEARDSVVALMAWMCLVVHGVGCRSEAVLAWVNLARAAAPQPVAVSCSTGSRCICKRAAHTRAKDMGVLCMAGKPDGFERAPPSFVVNRLPAGNIMYANRKQQNNHLFSTSTETIMMNNRRSLKIEKLKEE
jgi:hypothetical protein